MSNRRGVNSRRSSLPIERTIYLDDSSEDEMSARRRPKIIPKRTRKSKRGKNISEREVKQLKGSLKKVDKLALNMQKKLGGRMQEMEGLLNNVLEGKPKKSFIKRKVSALLRKCGLINKKLDMPVRGEVLNYRTLRENNKKVMKECVALLSVTKKLLSDVEKASFNMPEFKEAVLALEEFAKALDEYNKAMAFPSGKGFDEINKLDGKCRSMFAKVNAFVAKMKGKDKEKLLKQLYKIVEQKKEISNLSKKFTTLTKEQLQKMDKFLSEMQMRNTPDFISDTAIWAALMLMAVVAVFFSVACALAGIILLLVVHCTPDVFQGDF